MDDRDNPSMIELLLPDDLRLSLDQRGISETYIQQVITHAQDTSDKLVDKGTGHFIAHLPIGKITCWVEYRPESGGYRVYNAYAHRMQIEEGR